MQVDSLSSEPPGKPAGLNESPHDPLLRFDNLLEQLMELMKVFDLLLLAYLEATAYEQPDGIDALGKACGGGAWRFHILSGCTTLPAPVCVQQPGSTPGSFH